MPEKRRNKNFIKRYVLPICLCAAFTVSKAEESSLSLDPEDLVTERLEAWKLFTSENGTETEALTEIESEAVTETERELQPETISESETETELRTETKKEPETHAETELLRETESVTEAPAKMLTELQSGEDSDAEAETLTEPEAFSDTGSGRETGYAAQTTAGETGTDAGEETGNETERRLNGTSDGALTISEDLESLIISLAGVETGTEFQEEAETETEPETETETETEIETETETETETEEAFFSIEEERRRILLGEDFRIPMQMPGKLGSLIGSGQLYYGEMPFEKPFEKPEKEESTQNGEVIAELESLLEDVIGEYDGMWSVYVKNLDSNESFVINDEPMKSASVMKLFIMGAVYSSIEKGQLEQTEEIDSLLEKMVSYSDNESANELLYILGSSSYERGIAKVNSFIQNCGYSEMTVEYNGFSNPDTYMGGGSNQVAAKDVGQLLEDIYRRTWMSRASSNAMESLLLMHDTRCKIPAGLPEGVLCGNKSGEMTGTENDAAIIYADHCDYILVVLSSDWEDTDLAVSEIVYLSQIVYEFLNK